MRVGVVVGGCGRYSSIISSGFYGAGDLRQEHVYLSAWG